MGETADPHTYAPPLPGPGPNLARQVPRQFQHHSSSPVPPPGPRPIPPYHTHPAFQTPSAQRAFPGPREGEIPFPQESTPRQPEFSRRGPPAPSSGGDSSSTGGGSGNQGPPGGGGPHQINRGLNAPNQDSNTNIFPIGQGQGGGPPGDDPPDDPDHFQPRSPSPRPPRQFQRAMSDRTDYTAVRAIGEFHFDRKLKQDIVPTWDGNGDTLGDWLTTVGDLSDRGKTMYTELGQIVPHRLRGDAATWFWSLDKSVRRDSMHSWGTIRHKICEFFMNRMWMDKQKVRANKASYRESGYSQESPVQYVIRKLKLLRLVYEYTDSQLIVEIMSTAPRYWNQVLDPQRCIDLDDFMSGIKYHEEALVGTYSSMDLNMERRLRQVEAALQPQQYRPRRNFRPNSNQRRDPVTVNVNLVGSHPSLGPPQFPRDDSVVSKGKSPEDVNACPCRHCVVQSIGIMNVLMLAKVPSK